MLHIAKLLAYIIINLKIYLRLCLVLIIYIFFCTNIIYKSKSLKIQLSLIYINPTSAGPSAYKVQRYMTF